MKQNKNVVRLTESQLRNMIAESVSNVLNEIGDTRFGQYMLGRTSARQKMYPKSDDVDAFNYAYDRRQEDGLGTFYDDFQAGREDQDGLQYWIDAYDQHGDNFQASNVNQKRNDIKNNMHKTAYNSLSSYKKKVDDEQRAKDSEERHKMRKKYSLNNPRFKETNESKLNSKINRIVSESVKKVLREGNNIDS